MLWFLSLPPEDVESDSDMVCILHLTFPQLTIVGLWFPFVHHSVRLYKFHRDSNNENKNGKFVCG